MTQIRLICIYIYLYQVRQVQTLYYYILFYRFRIIIFKTFCTQKECNRSGLCAAVLYYIIISTVLLYKVRIYVVVVVVDVSSSGCALCPEEPVELLSGRYDCRDVSSFHCQRIGGVAHFLPLPWYCVPEILRVNIIHDDVNRLPGNEILTPYTWISYYYIIKDYFNIYFVVKSINIRPIS